LAHVVLALNAAVDARSFARIVLDSEVEVPHVETKTSNSMQMTFAEKYCAKNGIHPADYEAAVLRQALRPAARILRPFLNLNPNYFAADREFVRAVGRISRLDDFHAESLDFTDHPDGRGFCHRTLGWRVSRERLRRIVRETLKD
jgi:hypothetical protein